MASFVSGGTTFYHLMTPMYDVGTSDYDPTLSAFELEQSP
jgi:hypothetical protein